MCNPAELDKARALVVEDPEILSGTPVIRNTRIPVHDVAAYVTAGLPMTGSWQPIRGLPAKWSSLPRSMRRSTRPRQGRGFLDKNQGKERPTFVGSRARPERRRSSGFQPRQLLRLGS
jgi:uncharacterized protein DUF433